MKPGDLVQIIPELPGDEYRLLWDDPPDFSSIYLKTHTGKFYYADTGIVLEQRYVLDGPLHVRTAWVRVVCPTGMGWIKRCDTELIR